MVRARVDHCGTVFRLRPVSLGFKAGINLRSSIFHGKTHLDGHLPVVDFALVNITARFNDLKPAQVLEGG